LMRILFLSLEYYYEMGGEGCQGVVKGQRRAVIMLLVLLYSLRRCTIMVISLKVFEGRE
jgi:hypothetical protein